MGWRRTCRLAGHDVVVGCGDSERDEQQRDDVHQSLFQMFSNYFAFGL